MKAMPLTTIQRPTLRAHALGYHAHHFSCPVCIAAGQGIGVRCQTGLSLWLEYIAESDAVASPATTTSEASA